jgi:hypothetical protein
MKPSSCSIKTEPDDVSSERLYEFTAEQVKALAETRRKLNFTPQEVEERLRRTEAGLEWIAAAATLEEQQRRGTWSWAERVERPRAARRIDTARRPAPAPRRPTRPERATRIAHTKAAARTATPSRGDPDGDEDSDDGPWALSFVDRAPFLWRFRALRCRLHELWEGVDR